jgi:hypothetical protein
MKPIYTLHKLPEGFIVTSDEILNEGNTIININNFEIVENWQGHGSTDWWKKVIAQQDQIDFSGLSEEEQKEIGWVDWLRIAVLSEDAEIEKIGQEYHSHSWYKGVEFGFQKAQELLSDKIFTLEDIEKAIKFGQLSEKESTSKLFEKRGLVKTEFTKQFIQSLYKNSWQVELEMEECETHRLDECYSRFQCCENPIKPKLTYGKITITKIL